jgi:hypothetical protein
MISFIKSVSCHSVFPAAAQTGRGIMLDADWLNWCEIVIFLTDFPWICVEVFFLDVDE